jgi:hypothetical protein
MESLQTPEAKLNGRESTEIIFDIERAREAADALRALDGGEYRSEADTKYAIKEYRASIEGIDPQTMLHEGLSVFPGSSRLH